MNAICLCEWNEGFSWHLALFTVQKYGTYGSIYDFNSRRRKKSSNYISLTVLCFHMSLNQINVMFSSQIQHCSIHSILNTKQTTNIMVSLACIISVTLENRQHYRIFIIAINIMRGPHLTVQLTRIKLRFSWQMTFSHSVARTDHKPRNSTMKSKSSRPAQTIVI